MVFLSKHNHEMKIRQVIKIAQVKKKESVLDLGCGSKKLLKFLPKVNYVGIDVKGDPDIKWDLEKGLPSEVKEDRYDVIFMLDFLEHVENFKTLLFESKKLLTKKGRIIISVPSPYFPRFMILGSSPDHIHSFTKENLKNLARICNLRITKIIGSGIRIPKLFSIGMDQTLLTRQYILRLEPSK